MDNNKQTGRIRDMVYHICKRDYAKAHEALAQVVNIKNQVRYDQIEQKMVSDSNK